MKMVVMKAIILDIHLTHHVVGGVPEIAMAVSVFLAAQWSNRQGICCKTEDVGSNPTGASTRNHFLLAAQSSNG